MSHTVYEEGHLRNFLRPDTIVQQHAPMLPPPYRPAAHQGLFLDTDGDGLLGRAENGASPPVMAYQPTAYPDILPGSPAHFACSWLSAASLICCNWLSALCGLETLSLWRWILLNGAVCDCASRVLPLLVSDENALLVHVV